MAKRQSINEMMFFNGGYAGPGMDYTLSPASYTVQGTNTGYVYSLRGFDDSLQQKPNKPSNEYYIYPGCMVRGAGYNNPDKTYTGRVYRIYRNGKGEIIAIYILSTKTGKYVTIRVDDNLELLIPNAPKPVGAYNPTPQNDMDLSNSHSHTVFN